MLFDALHNQFSAKTDGTLTNFSLPSSSKHEIGGSRIALKEN